MKKFSKQKPLSSSGAFWIYGLHAVHAALENPKRRCNQLIYLSDEIYRSIEIILGKRTLTCHKVDKAEFQKIFPGDAVLQGIALQLFPLEHVPLEKILQNDAPDITIATLDQITDPQNLGAIARSAAAFGIQALIMPDRHTPCETSAIFYKSASGALEHISLIYVVNLAHTLEQLRHAGFWNLGFDERGEKKLTGSDLTGRINLVLGSEGEGLRRLTRERCDLLIQLPTTKKFSTLNVSNAATVAFYEACRQRKDNTP